MAKKSDLIIKVKGADWKVRLLPVKKFIKEYDDKTGAITVPKDKRIDFRKDEIRPSFVRHEIFHAFVSESNIDSTELTTNQMEELAASIMGENGIEIIQLADNVMAYLMDK